MRFRVAKLALYALLLIGPSLITDKAHAATFYTDEPLVAGVTPVKAIHIQEIRDLINAYRASAYCGGLPPVIWSAPDPLPVDSPVMAAHFNEILNEVKKPVYNIPAQYLNAIPTLAPDAAIEASWLNNLRNLRHYANCAPAVCNNNGVTDNGEGGPDCGGGGCPACPPCNYNTFCEPGLGENSCTCASDCGASCGDGCCSGNETNASCSGDCFVAWCDPNPAPYSGDECDRAASCPGNVPSHLCFDSGPGEPDRDFACEQPRSKVSNNCCALACLGEGATGGTCSGSQPPGTFQSASYANCEGSHSGEQCWCGSGGPVCGSNGCESGETCGNCSADCGICPCTDPDTQCSSWSDTGTCGDVPCAPGRIDQVCNDGGICDGMVLGCRGTCACDECTQPSDCGADPFVCNQMDQCGSGGVVNGVGQCSPDAYGCNRCSQYSCNQPCP